MMFRRNSILTTWTLWQHLLSPGSHPLFHRLRSRPGTNFATSYLLWTVPVVGSLLCCGIWRFLIHSASFISLILLFAMVCLSSCYVIAWATGISVEISEEYERGTFDPVCLSPPGALGASWAVCTAILHRDDALGWVNVMRKIIAGVFLLILLMVLVTSTLKEAEFPLFQFVQLMADIAALSAVSYIDHIQSIVLGSLVGMLIPAYARNGMTARIWTIGVFLTLQIVPLLVTIPLATLVLVNWKVAVSAVLFTLSVFCLVREAIIVQIWRILAYRLNANPAEFSFGS